MHSLRVIWAVFTKDLRVEWRNRETVALMVVFGWLVLFLFNFTLEPAGEESLRILPVLLWVTFAFVGILGFNRSFAAERENAGLEGMALAPADAGAIYLGKVLANLVFLGVAEVAVVFAASLWYNFSFVPAFPWFAVIVFLGTLGYVAVGTIFGAIAANTRMREIMLPVLQFPVSVPIFIAAIESTTGALRGLAPSQFQAGIRLLLAFDTVFLVLSYLLFEYVLEE
jgi:heme exporter protein B